MVHIEGYIFQTSLSVPYRGQITKKIPKFHRVYLIEVQKLYLIEGGFPVPYNGDPL